MRLTVKGALHFFSLPSSKSLDNIQSFPFYILSAKLSFHILFLLFNIMCTLCHRGDSDEQKVVVGVRIITRVADKMQYAKIS